MVDLSTLLTENVVGGVVSFFSVLYLVYQKFNPNNPDAVSQRSEVNAIEYLTQQRNISDAKYVEYHEKYLKVEDENQLLEHKVHDLENDLLDQMEINEELIKKVDMLNSIIKYLSESIELLDEEKPKGD